MPDYKKMCFQLFNRVTEAVELLQQGQREGEEAYVSAPPEPLPENGGEQRG